MARCLATGAYPAHLERARVHYRRGLDAIGEAVVAHLGDVARYVEPLGGGHLWLELDVDLDERELADEAVRHGVAYVPGGAVRVEPSPGLNLRLSYGYLEPEEIDEGLRRLATAVASLRRRPARREAVPV